MNDKNEWKWIKITQNNSKLTKIEANGPKWTNIEQNKSNWAELTQTTKIAISQLTELEGRLSKLRGPSWSKLSNMVQSQEKLPQTSQNETKLINIVETQLI